MKLRLIGYWQIKGTMELLTGLHVGKSKDDIEIGGNDNPIILTALDNAPYVPGSSLKGKLRSLLEWDTGAHLKGEVRGSKGNYSSDDPVLKVFGVPARKLRDESEVVMGPTRVLVSDSFLATEKNGGMRDGKPYDWLRMFKEGKWLTEEKNENSLNRITAMANPRPMERVPAGVQFVINIRYRVFDVNDDGGKTDRENFRWILWGLALLEQDALGGGGSRGSGMVAFRNLTQIDEKDESISVNLDEVRKNKPQWPVPAAMGGR
ncbi:MAG: type III-A CRISPR-associated RAMP protein Csm3 [Planctomycetota bacterium]